MRCEYGRDQIRRDERSVVTVGTFDGVHRGHQAVIRYLTERAQVRKGKSVVVSFDPHPRVVVRGEQVPLLTTIDERAALLDAFGLDRFVVLPFTEALSNLSAEAYVEEVLVGRIGLQEIVVGYDHKFGSDRQGDSDLLKRMGGRHGFAVDVISAQKVPGYGVISSSSIRQVLHETGDVTRAREMLGRPYRLTGTVIEGEKRGRKLGFPTANIQPEDPHKLIPRVGVYAVQVQIEDEERRYGGMMNVGRRPTFEDAGLHQEVHLLDFPASGGEPPVDANLYGKQLRVEFVRRLRDERRFASPEALVRQLSEDRPHCINALTALS